VKGEKLLSNDQLTFDVKSDSGSLVKILCGIGGSYANVDNIGRLMSPNPEKLEIFEIDSGREKLR
ncbi:hypothetical protein, partial [Klebsiella pneumoniae]|uniref:hypothetical protein n=1 Tax=Klebsiella pneumoniae TaxID=573 RepID=UPI0034E98631